MHQLLYSYGQLALNLDIGSGFDTDNKYSTEFEVEWLVFETLNLRHLGLLLTKSKKIKVFFASYRTDFE